MDTDTARLTELIDALVDEYRARCLWFLRPEYHPTTREEQLRVLGYIQRYGDLEAYRRASLLLEWLSRPYSSASAGS